MERMRKEELFRKDLSAIRERKRKREILAPMAIISVTIKFGELCLERSGDNKSFSYRDSASSSNVFCSGVISMLPERCIIHAL